MAKPLADYVAASKSLQLLSLGRTALGDAGVAPLCEALSRRPLDATAAAAAKKQIEEAKRKKGAEPPPFEEVAGTMYQLGNRSLQHLNLSHTSLTGEGAARLAAVLALNTVLRGVDLEGTLAAQEGSEGYREVQRLLQQRAPAS